MIRSNRNALTSAAAALLVLCASGSASALTIFDLKGIITVKSEVTLADIQLSGWSYDRDGDYYTVHFPSNYFPGWWQPVRGGTAAPAPEPSAALVFGIGLLAASRFARRSR